MQRDTQLERLRSEYFDVCVVGAGINGAVSACVLASRGLRVALVDRGDFGGATSSQSSNLAWGGIKYLESGEIRLVWDLCDSRNELNASYPSTVREIRFLTTVERNFRKPAFVIYLGALLYWAFGRFRTRAPAYLSRSALKRREPLIDVSDAVAGVEYSDCYLHDNDSRFVWNFVRRAIDRGAAAANYVEATAFRHDSKGWTVDARDVESGSEFDIRAKVLVNACGPWVDEVNEDSGVTTDHRHLLSKGIHLVVDRMMNERRILAFFASDGRLFFVMPMGPKTCIGTTDTRVDDPLTAVTDADRDFVLANANELLDLKQPLTREDIIAERCGVRPLAVTGSGGDSDWISLSRKHAIEVDREKSQISIFGGKITDCINVGEEIASLVESFGLSLVREDEAWFGEPDSAIRARFFEEAAAMGLDAMADERSMEKLSKRFWRRYGNDAFGMLSAIRENPRMAERVIDDAEYLRCEIEHTAAREMITRLEDFMRRRSKISLVVKPEDVDESPGLMELCRVLFGDDAERRLEEYRRDNPLHSPDGA